MSISKRSPRDKRIKNPAPMRLTERDLAIVQAVSDYRVLSTQHIQTLFFDHIQSPEVALKKARARLHKLYHHGFVDRKFSAVYFDKMNTPILYILDRRGAETLETVGKLAHPWKRKSKQVGVFFLEHALAINDVRVAVVQAAKRLGIELIEWRSENDLKASYDRVKIDGEGEPIAVIPDSYFELKTPSGVLHFFLEVDRSTESNTVFRRKIQAYQVYCGSVKAKQRFGATKFRILTITRNSARLQNLKRATEANGGKSRFWFTTTAQIGSQNILTASIWQVAHRSDHTSLIQMRPASAALFDELPLMGLLLSH